MSDEDYFDEAALEKLRQLGGDDFVRRMIDLFIDYAPKRLATARLGEQAGDGNHREGVHRSSPAPVRSEHGGFRNLRRRLRRWPWPAAALPPLVEQLEAALAQIKPRLEQNATRPHHEKNRRRRTQSRQPPAGAGDSRTALRGDGIRGRLRGAGRIACRPGPIWCCWMFPCRHGRPGSAQPYPGRRPPARSSRDRPHITPWPAIAKNFSRSDSTTT